jgi:hypothetical protein
MGNVRLEIGEVIDDQERRGPVERNLRGIGVKTRAAKLENG